MTSLITSLRPVSLFVYDADRSSTFLEELTSDIFPDGYPGPTPLSAGVRLPCITFTNSFASSYRFVPVYKYSSVYDNLNAQFLVPLAEYVSSVFSTVTVEVVNVDEIEGDRWAWYIVDLAGGKCVVLTQSTVPIF